VAAPTAEARKEAARKFEEGTRAFDAGDFTRAGEAFEAAYQLAPHEDPLWNAARAWHKAGEPARAANLYARYLHDAPPNARDRASATAALGQLASKLAQIEVHLGDGVEDPRVDGAEIHGMVVYLVPGMHVLRARSAQGEVESRQTIEAGGRVSVLLAPAPAPPAPAAPSAPPAPREAPPPSAPAPSGWSPIVVVVEGGVTLVLTGLAVWSGLETLATLRSFEATPTQESLDAGRSQEVRSNVLIGAAIGAAALTAITAVWFVDWGGRGRAVKVGLGPGAMALRGRF
jgi:Tetratricopeptide repeat